LILCPAGQGRSGPPLNDLTTTAESIPTDKKSLHREETVQAFKSAKEHRLDGMPPNR
jgi:hypothetical protein